MVIKPFKLFLLISFLFTFILSQNYVEVNFDGYYYDYFQESTTLQITFEPSDYIHIEISFEDKSPIVSMSKTDSKCKENRKLLGMQTYSPINLFFRQPELPNSQEYLCIQCQNNQKCNYHIIIEKAEKCKLSFGQQFSYLVDEKNTKMEFEFVDENNSNLRRLASIDSKLNFWVKGQNQLEVQEIFPSTAKKVEFDFGYTFSTEYKSGKSYILRVSAEEGDYVTVGSMGIDDNISKKLRINDLEIMGTLDSEQKEICFPIEKVNSNSLLSIKGNIFTKRGEIYFKRKGEIEEDTHKTIENGLIEALYFDSQASPDDDFCIRALDEYTNNFEIVFSLQLTSNKDDNLNRFIYSPLLPGVIYSHFLLKGEMAVFQAMKPKDGATEINFNMKALKGFPDMLFDECKDFPNCVYHPESLETSENPHHSNRMTVYSFYLDNNQKKEFTPLTPFQPLLIVNCIEGTNDEVHGSDYCLFETSIFTNKDRLNLIEGETYSQYLLSGESDLYTINIKDQENLQKVYVDLIIFSGDVDFNIENGLESHKYFISNKIFFSIHVESTDKKVDFTVTAYKNSFYMVQYQLVKDQGLTGNRNIIESGVNYIQSIIVGDNADFFKEFTFQNFKYASRTPYLASFYSQNCKFVVSRILRDSGDTDTITLYDSYGQIIIDEGDPDFEYDKYTFRLDITSDDVSNYEGKLCMLYITGLELSNTTTGSERYISVSDGVPQYFIFSKKYAYMKYSYHVSDQKSALIINFNLIDKAPYLVEVLFGYKPFIGRKIYRNEQIILYASQLQENCPEVDEVCTVNVNIELENKEDERERKLETTIYQYNGAPTFLEKNAEKQDILLGNEKKYYYLDIGQGEMGDITIDYKRGSGYIYAKVEPKVNMAFDPEADWRGIYKFPSHQNDSLRYETYLKKIIITPEDTKECEFGCYLLITVINTFFREYSAFDEKIAFLPYRISIIPRIYTEDYVEEKSKPRVKIKVNDFIIGNLYQTYDKIFEFYSVTLPYESEFVFIDWQADKSSLYINVGDERPTLESSDFKFESTGYDTIFSLRKEDILKKLGLGSDADTLRNVELTLGIWTEKLDTLYTSVYAFKIFMPPSYKGGLVPESFEIYHVRTDQKVQCEPYEIFDYRYMCVFAVIFDDADVNGTLVVYPKAQKETVSIEFKGALVDSEQIERNNLPYILDQIENLKVEFTSENGDKYMYVNKIVKNKCLLFFAYADEKTYIEVLSSTYLLFENLIFSPNPSTPQIFALGDQSLNFLFETTKDLLINIVSIAGEGFFYWGTEQEDNNLYHLSRYADRLTLTSGTQIIDNKLTFLTAKPFITDEDKKKGGFIFYMTFYPRNGEENVDQVKVGRSTEFVYRDLKFPLNYFTRLEDKDVSISFTFYNFHLNRNEIMYEKPLFNLWGKIIKEDDAFNSRYDKRFWPENDSNSIKGSIDGPFATLLLTAKDIQKFKIYEEYNPNLFFSLELNDETLFTKFNEIDIEVSILKEQSLNETELYATKNVYYNGRLTNDRTISSPKYIYKLQVDHANPYMRIEFSSNSDLVHWVVTIDRNSKKDYEEFIDFNKRYINGRYLMTFKIPETVKNSLYLIVFNDDKTTVDPRLTNFVFKYIDSNDKDSFFEFPVENDTIQCTKNEKNGLKSYTITFSPIEQYDVTYYIKGIYAKSKIEGEWMNSIAISESDSYNLQLDNPKYEGEDKLSVTLDDIKEEISDIKIMAQIELTSLREFVLYEPLAIKNDDTPDIPVEGDEIPPSRNVIPINIKTSEEYYTGNANNAYKIQKYKLNFDDKSKISNYLSIGILSFDSVDNNKIMYISTSDENGKKDRIQLVQSGVEKFAYIFVKKEQIVNNLFIVVECQINDEERCNYSLSVVKYDYINSVLMFNKNIYITEKNKIMNFKLIYLKEETAPILSVYVNSGKPLNLILTDKSGKKYDFDKFKNGAAITIKTNEREFDVEVQAEEGDYISFGDKLIDENGKSDLNILKPYENPITGFLKRGILENECYSIDDESPSYIVGQFYNQMAEISFKDENYKDISNSKELIKKGYYTYIHGNESKNIKYICVGMPNTNEYNLDYLAYSLQITKSESQNVIPTPPLLSGNIHPKILKRGTYAYFSVGYLNSNSDEVAYNMIATEGSPKMYIYKCNNYPLCEINFENNQNLISINELNRMSLWLNKEKILSPIDPEQYVMVVKCDELGRSDSDVCQFQVSMYGNKDDVNLIEGQQFSQYLLKGKNSRFAIDFSGDKSVTKVFIDIFVISGDVGINLKNEEGNEMKSLKYYLSNKIFYSVSKTDNSNIKNIFVNIDAKVNSYYIIEYKLIRESANEDTYDIYDGINYLIPIPNEGNGKKINIHNLKLLYEDFYLANFYSLNCDIKVNRINQNGKEEAILSSFINSGEDIISRENTNVINYHSYSVSIVEPDSSQYNNNLCMLYVSGLEMTQNPLAQKEILLSEGIPHKAVFMQPLSKIKYVYPNPDRTKNIAVHFKVINPANYTMSLIFNSGKKEQKYFYQSNIEYVEYTDINNNCTESNLCSITILLEVTKQIENYVPTIEVSIRQIDNIPFYFSKGVLRQDFVAANSWTNLYTIVGKNDEGYINVDFARGSGLIYAKVLPINGAAESNPDWRQYKFPREQKGTLKYDFYDKKILFKKDDTSKCDEGCYLLISLQPSAIGKFDEQFRFFEFAMTVSIIPDKELKKNGPIIKIEPEEYVIGSLTNSEKIKNKDMYEFYQLYIPFDAEKIEFDWQSDSAKLLLNVGENRPTMDSALIKKESRSDTIFELSPSDLKLTGKNIANTLLTIGVYTENMESEFGTPYSFRVHFARTLDIYKITSDHKTLCKPTQIDDDEYRCLFMIIYNELDFLYDVMAYAKSQNPSALLYMVGNFIDKDIYDQLDMDKLDELIPDGETAAYNTAEDNLDFIFLTLSDYESHFYISVLTNKPEPIEFITSFKTFDTELSPNPSSTQLFSINNNPSMKLKFKTTKPIFINFVCLYGSSKIYLEDEKNTVYHLRDRDDRLSLAIPPNTGKETILIVENLKYDSSDTSPSDDNDDETIEKPGVAFYLDYNLRSLDKNLDEIFLGNTAEIAYKQSDFPVYYYSKLDELNNDINVFFNLHDLELTDKKLEERVIKTEEFVFKGSVIPQNTIYELKTDKNAKVNNEKSVSGKYDPALQTGQIYLTSENLKTNAENPTLYLSFEKQEKINVNYKSIRLELTVVEKNRDNPVTEKLYQYGTILNKDDINSYKLKVDNKTGEFRIQFAANSKNVNFAINNEKGKKENSTLTDLKTKTERGKLFLTFKKPSLDFIYLNVFLNDKVSNADKRLNNYVFKYVNARNISNLAEYPILNNNAAIEGTMTKDKKSVEVKFNKINKDNIDVVYTLKYAKKSDLSKEEIGSTIAISESPSYVTQVHNPKGEKITLKMNNIEGEYAYVEVFALIKDGPVVEYVAYEPNKSLKITDKSSETNSDDDENNNKTLIIVISCVGGGVLLLLIILIVIVVLYNSKTKDLLENVNKISFADGDDKKDKNENLLLDNELK